MVAEKMFDASSVGNAARIPGSFRDPAGHVLERGDDIFREISSWGAPAYAAARDAGIFLEFSERGWLVPIRAETVMADKKGYIIKVDRIPWISYPYEWSFALLKCAALFHLDFHLSLLDKGFTLSDATAYNVQFLGPKPIFIDHLSLRPYRDGEFWAGHRQFCEQFLNPLLLRAYVGRPHNAWYRGAMEGIAVADIAAVIPTRRKFTWNVFTNVVLQDRFQAGTSSDAAKISVKDRSLPKRAFVAMLQQLRNWISSLEPGDKAKTVWADYSLTNTYSDAERDAKHRFVADYVADVKPKTVVDLGCNTGEYSERALDAGAQAVIGFDYDVQALDRAYQRSIDKGLNILPLFLDARNPSSGQGWLGTERMSFSDRIKADGLLALAFEHHLAIAHNVPLDQLVRWLVSVAPTGVIEFVPKTDSTVEKMLALREDIFHTYEITEFERHLGGVAEIVRSQVVSQSGRTLFQYRNSNVI
ncbi:class I SAM-dependent methyltransferase [Rhizobium skierniewicense]|uniref:class I SAM-dependent methyltransferase n=1 Tax=Rhizobium skierniewicense TaxID=984260 RepID=UPI001F24D796|nr:class I SAM-dependent methyltransferase [Rhizobium skierniewicense]